MPARTVAGRLLRWFDVHRRDLPWRLTRDPWAILVSEIMLQQTRVETVRHCYERFLVRYPVPAAFARCSDDELLAAWRGLGYYRRARLLRESARAIVRDHAGHLPADATALGELPGVGAYTRGAVASIAFGLPLPAIDGNVERVVARHRGIDHDIATANARRLLDETTRRWLDPRRAGDFNQAVMELGATVCTPTQPRCGDCPLARDCVALRTDRVDRLPVRKPRGKPTLVHARCLVVRLPGGLLAFRTPSHEPNAGHWDLPGPGVLVDVAVDDLAAATAARCGVHVAVGQALTTVRHSITQHRIELVAHAGSLIGPPGRDVAVVAPADPAAPWATTALKVLSQLQAAPRRTSSS